MLAESLKMQSNSLFPVCYFASGVSNSTCVDPNQFLRERQLLLRTMSTLDSAQTLIYFSTCSVYDSQLRSTSMYIKHKLALEGLVSRRKSYLIFRLPQVVGLTSNTFTLVNYFKKCMLENKLINIQKYAVRNIIDVYDVSEIANSIVDNPIYHNSIVNIANTFSIGVVALVEMLEKILNVQARCKLLESGSAYTIDTEISDKIALDLKIDFTDDYVRKVLSKYYSEDFS